MGVTVHPKELQQILHFAIYAMYYKSARARTFYLYLIIISLLMVIQSWAWYQNVWKFMRNKIQVKKRSICEAYVRNAETRTRARTRAQIFEMLKIAWNVSKKNSRSIWAFFNFDARVRARRGARTDMNATWHYILTWNLCLPKEFLKITFNYEDMVNHVTLRRNHKMAPIWRHAWVIAMKTSAY